MCNKKLFFFDFDDTVFTPKSPETIQQNIEAIDKLRKNGHIVTIITARSLDCLRMNMSDVAFHVDYIVANDGTITYQCTANGGIKPIYQHAMDGRALRDIEKIIRSLSNNERYEIVSYISDVEQRGIILGSSKIRIWTKSAEHAAAIHQAVNDNYGDTLHSFIYPNVPEERHHDAARLRWTAGLYNAVDIYDLDVSKEAAIGQLCSERLPQGTETIAFGDHWNDMGMLEKCDYAFIIESERSEGILKHLASKKNVHIVESVHSALNTYFPSLLTSSGS